MLASFIGDSEGVRLGLQIRKALEGAKFQIDNELGSIIMTGGSGPVFGINVIGPKAEYEMAQDVAKSLSDRGQLQAAAISEKNEASGDVLQLFIALRPLEAEAATNSPK